MGKGEMNRADIIKMAAEAGAKAGIEAYEKKAKQTLDERADKRLRNTKLLLRNYRMFKAHCDNAVYEVEALDETVYDILDMMTGNESAFVESIKQSVARTALIVKHVDTMLHLYETYCFKFGNAEDQRRHRVINALYIEDKPTTIEFMANFEGINERTIYKDVDNGCDKLSALIFGIDGVKKT